MRLSSLCAVKCPVPHGFARYCANSIRFDYRVHDIPFKYVVKLRDSDGFRAKSSAEIYFAINRFTFKGNAKNKTWEVK